MSNSESLSSKVVIAFLTAILAFFGAVGGTFITGSLQRKSWERDIVFQNQQSLLLQRLELIEKTVRVLNSQDMAKTLSVFIKANKDISQLLIQQRETIDSKTYEQFSSYTDNYKTLELRTQLENLNTEYATVLSLNRIYFGPKTNKAITSLTENEKEWWNILDEEKKALLDAMTEEYNYATQDIKAIP